MLLKNGKPYQLEAHELKEFREQITWHVEPKPYDTVNNRHGIGAGVAFPNNYVRIKDDGSTETWTYYTREMYDDSVKRTRYYVENTGEMIVIGEIGFIKTKNAELNFFLEHCPWNGNNAMRHRQNKENPYVRDRILFYRLNPQASQRLVNDRNKARRELFNVIDLEGDTPWSDFSIVTACKSVLADPQYPIPQVIIDWRDYEDEKDTPTLRGGLAKLIEDHPLWLKQTLITGRIFYGKRLLEECLAHSEHSGLEYSVPERKYTERLSNKKTQDWLVVPEGKDPNRYTSEALLGDYRLFEKLQKMHDRIPKENLVR